MKDDKKKATKEQVRDLIKGVDKNGDGKIGKIELLEVFKKVANIQKS